VTKQGPPTKIEMIVALLTPPARREEVLGDLYERYKSPAQYVFDAAVTVPLVVASQIRRTADPGVVLLEALSLYFCFFAGDGHAGAGFFQQPQVLRILIQVISALFGLRLADAYMTSRSPQQLSLRATAGVGLACLSESLLATARPDLALSGWALFRDGGFAVMILSLLQMSSPAFGGGFTPAAAGGKRTRREDAARSREAAFDTRWRGRSLWEYFAAAFVFLAFGLLFAETQNRAVRLGAGLILFAGLWRVLSKSRTNSSTKPTN
jgi:hypothetical protein